MRQIALGLLVTAVFTASASAQEPTTPSLRSAIRGVTFTTPAAVAQATPAAAPEPRKVNVTVGADMPTVYYFRGYRQEADPTFTFQPFVDVGVTANDSVTLNFGAWNSLHTGSLKDAGAGYYETDLYASATVGMIKALYTAYTYPKIDGATIHELMFASAIDDSESAFPLAPSVGVAFEFQKANGLDKGIYLELGVAPGVPLGDDAPVSITFPVKFGFSLKDYYGSDKFGYGSVGATLGVPVNDALEFHGGVTAYFFGDFLKAVNGEDNNVVGSAGLTVKF